MTTRDLNVDVTAAEVATVTFPATRLREGYDIDEVTALLTVASDTLAGYERVGSIGRSRGGMLAAEVRQARFTPTKFRRGWDQTPVDDFLDRVVATLERYERRPVE